MRATRQVSSLLAIMLAAGIATIAAGQETKKAETPAGKAQAATPLRDLFLELDANGDRVIEKQEVPESGLKAFDTLLKHGDSNHDGKLEASEYRALLERVNFSRVIPPAQLERRFKSLDKNEDGKLDRQEFPGVSARFDRLDKNGDGVLTRDEMPFQGSAGAAAQAPAADRPTPAAGRPLLQRLRAMDKDGDGRVSREEFTGRPAAFDRLDSNHDGYLDQNDRRQGPRPAGKRARPEL